MIEFAIKYWLECGFGLLCAAVVAGYRAIIRRLKARRDEDELIKDGLLALLHDRLYQGCRYHIGRKEIEDDEMKNMEYLYGAYHDLGGNGTGTELYERVKKLPLKEEK